MKKLLALIPLTLLGVFVMAGVASAHTAQVSVSPATCISTTAWKFTLTVVPTDLDKAPVATVSNSAGPYTVHTFPYSTVFTEQSAHATVSVAIQWNDGVAYNSGPLTVNAPPGGCSPTSTTAPTPTTTTCDRAVPPRTDCGAPVPPTVPTTITPIVEPTSIAPPDTTTTVPPVATTIRRGPSTTRPVSAALPVTGAGDTAGMVVAALFAISLGSVLVYSVKRRTVR
jgi:hypothetical protein